MLGDGMRSYDNDKDGRTTELAGCEVSGSCCDCHPICLSIVISLGQLSLKVIPNQGTIDILQEQLSSI